MSDELIELVRQRKVLYDTTAKEYKDQCVRNAAWEEIAEILNEAVEKCNEEWSKLRNAFTNAIKRRKTKKSGQAAVQMTPWKYEESMSFLLPHMESRNTKANLRPPPSESPSIPSEIESPPESPYSSIESQSQRKYGSRRQTTNLQDIYDLMKSSNDIRQQRLISRQDMDDTDLFFLAMSKAVKALPKIDQTKIKLDLHTAISQVEIRLIEQREKTLRTPINIIAQECIATQNIPASRSQSAIQSAPIPTLHGLHNQSFTYIQSPTNKQSSTYTLSPTNAQLPIYVQSATHIQSPTYLQSPTNTQSPTCIQPSIHIQSAIMSLPSTSSSVSQQPATNTSSEDLKTYYNTYNFE